MELSFVIIALLCALWLVAGDAQIKKDKLLCGELRRLGSYRRVMVIIVTAVALIFWPVRALVTRAIRSSNVNNRYL